MSVLPVAQADDADVSGEVRLVEAFWRLVRHDLKNGSQATYAWLKAPSFAWWIAVCCGEKVMPDEARQALIDTCWRRWRDER